MCYTAREGAFMYLASQGLDDLLIGYPAEGCCRTSRSIWRIDQVIWRNAPFRQWRGNW